MSGRQFQWGTVLPKSNGGVHQGWLAADGNRSDSIKAKASLTARRICRAGAKAGLSEPTFYEIKIFSKIFISVRRNEEDYQIKATLGITGWYCPSVHSDGSVRHLDVGSPYPGGEEAPKGLAVRQLKRYASWVQTVVRQVGLYLVWALILERSCS